MTTEGLPPEARFGRVGLRVAHAESLSRFYEEVVGLASIAARDGQIALGAGDQPLLILHDDPNAPPRPRDAAGLFHTAFRVPTRGDLGAALQRIRLVNALRGASDHGFSEALYLTDPEDNGIEIYRDKPTADWPRREDGALRLISDQLDLADLPRPSQDARLPATTEVGHVHLEVTELDRAIDFYRDVLGFSLTMHPGDDAAFLAAGEYHHHVGLNTWNGRSAPLSGRGLAWLELVVPTPGDLADIRGRLDASDYDASPIDDGLSVIDPDGIRIRCVTR